ncbi:hypothetical protein E2562_004556 [Oryza meyeriana var. granulata]|uniref:F-box associated beta-propeller type 3 domain-containing protein n=1 Tax=Oryza meyeriana var. granulata TaxID=110450 RepID=A0A6G1F3L3_9ORYZ|nr:hypothetical protein E2562_004556 [Oryza meyeriana var. granulata]
MCIYRRRRLRLVCRHWRNVIDERTPVRLGGAKTLAFVNHRPTGSAAYVLDDLVEGRVRELWSSASNPNSLYSHMRMVGTCNGLLCLYDESAGDIALLNPVTGETLDVPGPPSHRLRPQGAFCSAYYERFSFAYHVATERYKIVHLALNGHTRAMDVVQVLTLGADASWRNVPAPAGSSCCPLFGVVSDGQATYWISDDANMLMSFDLTNERVAPVRSLPAPGSKFGISCLRKVYGRPCVAARTYVFLKGTETEEMWLLERGGWLGRERWHRRFYVTGQVSIIPPLVQRVMGPHFVQGEHILTCCPGSLYAHRFVSSVAWPQCRVVQIDEHW